MMIINIVNNMIMIGMLVQILLMKRRNQVEKQALQLQIESLSIDNKRLSYLYDGVRSIKHDFLNFIQALEGYVKCKDISGIDKMLQHIFCENQMTTQENDWGIEEIHQPAVLNLLNAKYLEAKKKNIVMQVEIEDVFSKINISIYEFCKVLGILVDNAIEAAEETDEKRVVVHLFEQEEVCVLEVGNSYRNQKIDITKIFEKGFTTKENSQEHGLGLWILEKMLQKRDNIELHTYLGHYFVQQLMIKKKREK